jgi:hypothetical protein
MGSAGNKARGTKKGGAEWPRLFGTIQDDKRQGRIGDRKNPRGCALMVMELPATSPLALIPTASLVG